MGTLSTAGSPTSDTLSYRLAGGRTANHYFTISGNALQTRARFAGSKKTSYTIRVQSTDSNGRVVKDELIIFA